SYAHGELIAFLIERLQGNNFLVQFYHPNILLISWQHIYPTFVRDKFHEQTGLLMDMYGHVTDPEVLRQEEEARKREADEAAAAVAASMAATRRAGGPTAVAAGGASAHPPPPSRATIYQGDMLSRAQRRMTRSPQP